MKTKITVKEIRKINPKKAAEKIFLGDWEFEEFFDVLSKLSPLEQVRIGRAVEGKLDLMAEVEE